MKRLLMWAVAVRLATVIVWRIPIGRLDFAADATYAQIIINGGNPYKYGVVPRPPSAWLLQMPLAWIDPILISRAAGVAAAVTVAWLCRRLLELRLIWLPVLSVLVAASFPLRVAVVSGNMASVVAVLVCVAWARRSGVLVGAAAALRMYPMIFAFPVKRWRTTVSTVGVLTVAGLMLVPDSGVADLVENGGAFLDHPGTTSIARFLGYIPAIMFGVVMAWRSRRTSYDHGMSLAAVAAALVPPVSWPGYHLVLFPAAAWALTQRRWWVLAAVPFWLWNDFSVWLGLTDLGQVHFAAAVIVLTAIGKAPRSSRRRTEGPREDLPRMYSQERLSPHDPG